MAVCQIKKTFKILARTLSVWLSFVVFNFRIHIENNPFCDFVHRFLNSNIDELLYKII